MATCSLFAEKNALTAHLLHQIKTEQYDALPDTLQKLTDEDIAEIIETTPHELREKLWHHLPNVRKGLVATHLRDEVRAQLLTQLPEQVLVEILSSLSPDDAVDLLQTLSDPYPTSLIQYLPPQQRQQIERLLPYPPDTAGGVMQTDLFVLPAEITVKQALQTLRQHPHLPKHLHRLYLEDPHKKYRGSVLISDLLHADDNTPIQELIDPQHPSIPYDRPVTEIAHQFEKNDLISAAVVDPDGLLLGRITIDDMVDAIREEEAAQHLASAGLDQEDDLFAPATTSVKRRAFWLGSSALAASAGALVISQFNTTIEKAVVLAALMPIVAALGGIAGNQTAILIIRAMATGKLTPDNTTALIKKELTVGLLNGLLWAAISSTIIWVIYHDLNLCLIFASTMIAILFLAALIGAFLPLGLKKLGIDPPLASGILAPITDALSFSLFLGLATLILFT